MGLFRDYVSNNPLSIRLVGNILFFSSLITIVAIGLLLYQNYLQGYQSLTSRVEQVTQVILPSIAQSMWNFDEPQLKIQLESIALQKNVAHVKILTHDLQSNELVISTDADNHAARNRLGSVQFVSRSYPITLTNSHGITERLGVLQVDIELRELNYQQGKQAVYIILFQGGKTFFISLITLYLIQRLLMRHVAHIAAFTRQLTIGSLDKPLTLKRSMKKHGDELDDVVAGMNSMRERLLNDIHGQQKMYRMIARQNQEKLLANQQKLLYQQKADEKTQYLSSISHEIRTPVNGIIGAAELLKTSKLDGSQLYYLDVVLGSAASLLGLINDILDLSKIEAGKMEIENIPFRLSDIIKESIKIFSVSAQEKKLLLFACRDPEIPDLLVGDPTRIKQILLNLLSNAIKFTHRGYVSLEVTSVDRNEQLDGSQYISLQFVVCDTGDGIDNEGQKVVFDAYRQVSNSIQRRYGGTGLGLSICKMLCDKMQGEIGVSSQPGIGSKFFFTLRLPFVDEQKSLSSIQTKKNVWTLGMPPLLFDKIERCLISFHMRRMETQDLEELLFPSFSTWDANQCNPTSGAFNTKGKLKEGDILLFDELCLASIEGKFQRYIDKLLTLNIFSAVVCSPNNPMKFDGIAHVHKPVISDDLLHMFSLAGNLDCSDDNLDSKAAYIERYACNILIIEDNPVNAMLLRQMLVRFGIHAEVATSGKETLTCIANKRYDILFVDYELPDIDGISLTDQIRESNQASTAKLIMLTAHFGDEFKQNALQAGIDDVVTKPINLQRLRVVLDKHLFSQFCSKSG